MKVALVILLIAAVVYAEEDSDVQTRGQLSGLFEVPGRVLGIFGGRGNGGRGENGNTGTSGQNGGNGGRGTGSQSQVEDEIDDEVDGGSGNSGNSGQNGGNGGRGNGQQEQQQGGQEEPLSCTAAYTKCNSNILCGQALRKVLPVCQNTLLSSKRCFKCQAMTSILTATPEGRAYSQCECGSLDLYCKARKRFSSNCVGGQ